MAAAVELQEKTCSSFTPQGGIEFWVVDYVAVHVDLDTAIGFDSVDDFLYRVNMGASRSMLIDQSTGILAERRKTIGRYSAVFALKMVKPNHMHHLIDHLCLDEFSISSRLWRVISE